MKKQFIVLITVLLTSICAFSQSPRKCGCKTWREWNSEVPKGTDDTRWKRKHNYDVYLNKCLTDCRQRLIRGGR